MVTSMLCKVTAAVTFANAHEKHKWAYMCQTHIHAQNPPTDHNGGAYALQGHICGGLDTSKQSCTTHVCNTQAHNPPVVMMVPMLCRVIVVIVVGMAD
eukprot:scaffold11628_cov28-Tisochrysis_lutea.AAC.1